MAETTELLVADECWIGLALLHQSHPDRVSFSAREILERLKLEQAHLRLRAGVPAHIYQHNVANVEPSSARYRMFYGVGKGLWAALGGGDAFVARERQGWDPPVERRQEKDLARIFWDTNLFIYLFEEHPAFAPQVEQLRRRMLSRDDRLFTSALTVGEILVGPFATGDTGLAQQYTGFFKSPTLHVAPFDMKAASLYARIRQDHTITRPDAIQLACAAAAEIELFITNDARLSRKVVPGVAFICSLERAPI